MTVQQMGLTENWQMEVLECEGMWKAKNAGVVPTANGLPKVKLACGNPKEGKGWNRGDLFNKATDHHFIRVRGALASNV